MFRLASLAKYHAVHFPLHVMKIENLKSKAYYLSQLPLLVLTVAVGFGWYVKWLHTKETEVLVFSIVFFGMFSITCVCRYYFSFEDFSQMLMHLWIGSCLGVLIFEDNNYQYTTSQKAADCLFMLTLILSYLWRLLRQYWNAAKKIPQSWLHQELMECLGFMISNLVMNRGMVIIALLVIALLVNQAAIRVKSFLLFTFIILSLITVKTSNSSLQIPLNKYVLFCFVGRQMCDSIIDLLMVSSSTFERWQVFLYKSKTVRHLTVVFIFVLNLTTIVMIGHSTTFHKEWFIVSSIYILLAIIWFVLHFICFIASWQLMTKLTECNNFNYISFGKEQCNLNKIYASKGIRHFSLIFRRVFCFSLVSTLILAAIGWETQTSYTTGLILIIVPLEGMMVSLLGEFSYELGGTCIGYALVTPANTLRSSEGVKFLQMNTVQRLANQAMRVLDHVNKFFRSNMIFMHRCDLSHTGFSLDELQKKIQAFFEQRTTDGLYYDTYLLFFCGDAYDSGDWALTEKNSLNMNKLMEWWTLKDAKSDSRLIFVLDTHSSYKWIRNISQIRNSYVALQTCHFTAQNDPELGEDTAMVGEFAVRWISHSLNADVDMPEKAVFAVSESWTDFTFRMLTKKDLEVYWENNFPAVTKPLMKVIFFSMFEVNCCLVDIIHYLKRKKMKWFPPEKIDTGHGFSLVKSWLLSKN